MPSEKVAAAEAAHLRCPRVGMCIEMRQVLLLGLLAAVGLQGCLSDVAAMRGHQPVPEDKDGIKANNATSTKASGTEQPAAGQAPQPIAEAWGRCGGLPASPRRRRQHSRRARQQHGLQLQNEDHALEPLDLLADALEAVQGTGIGKDEAWAVCTKGYTCVRLSANYWQCQPGNGNVTYGLPEPAAVVSVSGGLAGKESRVEADTGVAAFTSRYWDCCKVNRAGLSSQGRV
jgi:hypothetical protein